MRAGSRRRPAPRRPTWPSPQGAATCSSARGADRRSTATRSRATEDSPPSERLPGSRRAPSGSLRADRSSIRKQRSGPGLRARGSFASSRDHPAAGAGRVAPEIMSRSQSLHRKGVGAMGEGHLGERPMRLARSWMALAAIVLIASSRLVLPAGAAGTAGTAIGFGKSLLGQASPQNSTSLQFGPDGRLYVAQADGAIEVYSIERNAPNDYSVTATETITKIQSIPNHNDDGTPAPDATTRLV